MSFSHRIFRFTAVLAIALGAVTFDALPNSSPSPASAAVTYQAPGQTGKFAMGGEHMCVVADSFLNCAGDNSLGQLGDGTTTDVPHLKQVGLGTDTMLLANVFHTAGGLNHACVLTTTGVAYCWGDNQFGQLGDGTRVPKLVPTKVADNSAVSFVNTGVQQIIAGYNHTCVVKLGKIFCWGLNRSGQLGDGSTTNSLLPVQTLGHFATNSPLNGFTAGEDHTCATSFSGNYEPYCWGDNQYGQLGDGSNTNRPLPVMVSQTNTQVRNAQQDSDIAATANSTCLVGSDRSVYCWGRNQNGQLGNNTTTNSNIPVIASDNGTFVNTGSSTRYLAGGGDTMCVRSITVSGPTRTLHCWGGNAGGQISGSTNAFEKLAISIAANPVEAYDPTLNNTNDYLGVSKSTTTGFVCHAKWCWGSNSQGQLASDTTTLGATLVAPVKYKIGREQQSGGGGGNNSLSALTAATLTELPDLKIQISVTGLLAGGRIGVMAFETNSVPANPITELPTSQLGEINVTTKTISGVLWLGMTMNATPRTEAFVAGKGYTFTINQRVGSSSSASLTKTFTFTGAVTTPTTSTVAPTTTVAPATTVAPTTTVAAPVVLPGITVTDTKVYSTAPVKVAEGSAISVMTASQAKLNDLKSLTPAICLPADDDLVFIATGRCVAQIVGEKTGNVIRTLSTRVIAVEVSELKIGNEIVTIAPIYFENGSSLIDARARRRILAVKDKATAAGTVLLVGHSGGLLGNTPENQALARERAVSARKVLQATGAKGPFYVTSAGALDPATTAMTKAGQSKNRRVVIILIP